jgi:hypothetical protein
MQLRELLLAQCIQRTIVSVTQLLPSLCVVS